MQPHQTPAYKQAMRIVDLHRPSKGEFWRETTYDGLDLSLLFERDEDGYHLREIWAASVEIHWIPKHICCLIKAQALSEMEGERA